MIYFVGLQHEMQELVSNDVYSIATIDSVVDYFKEHKEIQVDTETEGFDPHTANLKCFQLGDYHNQFVIQYSKDNFNAIKHYLEDSSIVKIFQNAKFDLRFFLKQGIIIHNVYDTFLAECVLYTGYNFNNPAEPYFVDTSLKGLAEKYCNVFLDKSIRSQINIKGFTGAVIKYAAEDVKYLSSIKEQQLEKIKELDLQNVLDLENKAVIAFANLEYNGITVDISKWNKVSEMTSKLMKDHEAVLDSIIMEDELFKPIRKRKANVQIDMFTKQRDTLINWGSATQKLQILKLIVPEIESTGERELMRFRHKHKLFKELISFNKFKKLSDSFGEKFVKHVNKSTARVHCDIWQIISTGRISVSDPNLNQIPAKGEYGELIRSCFISKEGYSIVGGDYSGMELRILAEISEDPLWLKIFDNNEDLHSVLCASTFNIDIKDVKNKTPFKPDVSYRDIQKIINFGLAYGMTEYKLADSADIPIPKAKGIIEEFFCKVPFVKTSLDMLGGVAVEFGRSRTMKPFRRIRWYPEHESAVEEQNDKVLGAIERAGKNAPIQGTNGDIIKLALWRIQEKIDLEKLDIKILLSVYDEIRTECPDEIAEWWKEQMNTIMIESAQYVLKRVPIVVDCKVSKCWEK
jgi:DNA polymerase-1